MIVIDNYDSFTYNLVEYLKELNVNPTIYKNDEITIDELKKKNFSSILISPGPGTPKNSGISKELIKNFKETKKILGVCLGHQVIAEVFNAKVKQAAEPVHGKVYNIKYKKNEILFKGLKQNFKATRYHSLVVDKKSIKNSDLIDIAWTKDGTIMALKHKKYKIYGVQFHPESILTEGGKVLLKNFLNLV